MTHVPHPVATGSEGRFAPPIKVACAPDLMPARLQRTRVRHNFTPAGATYVGRPTLYSNPFERRRRIGHKRSVILYEAWVLGRLSPYILSRCGFGRDEIASLYRWRQRLLRSLPGLRGRDLQCWCPLTSEWCHANVLLRLVNDPFALARLLASEVLRLAA